MSYSAIVINVSKEDHFGFRALVQSQVGRGNYSWVNRADLKEEAVEEALKKTYTAPDHIPLVCLTSSDPPDPVLYSDLAKLAFSASKDNLRVLAIGSYLEDLENQITENRGSIALYAPENLQTFSFYSGKMEMWPSCTLVASHLATLYTDTIVWYPEQPDFLVSPRIKGYTWPKPPSGAIRGNLRHVLSVSQLFTVDKMQDLVEKSINPIRSLGPRSASGIFTWGDYRLDGSLVFPQYAKLVGSESKSTELNAN